jgi:hypothetical protein
MDQKLHLHKYFPLPSATVDKAPLGVKEPLSNTAPGDSSPPPATLPFIYTNVDAPWSESRSGRELLEKVWSTKEPGTWNVMLSITSVAELEVLSQPEVANELLEAVDGISLRQDLCQANSEQCLALYDLLRNSHSTLRWLLPEQFAQTFSKTLSTGSNSMTRIWAPDSVPALPPQTPTETPPPLLALSSREFCRKSASTPEAEIAFLLYLGLSRLQQAEAAGWNELTPLPVDFEVCATPDIFTQIAKLRALSILWQLIVHEVGLHTSNVPTNLLVYTSKNIAQVEPHKALLRSICQSIGAIMGGATHVIVEGSDHSSPEAAIRSLRLARNIQLIARYESKIGDILDPVGGSWYAEELTKTLMTTAWKLFQKSQRVNTP